MKSKVEIKTEEPGLVKNSIKQCFRDGGKAEFDIEARKEKVAIRIDANTNGVMRACSDSAFRLALLSEKIRSR